MSELVTFHGDTRLIIVEPGITEIDVEADVYSAWKRWMTVSDNSKWPIAMRTVGGDPLSDTKNLGSTFFLLNGWRIRPQEADHWLTVNGNLYTDPAGSSPFVSTLGAWTVTISMVVSNLSDASLAQMPEIEFSSFEGHVWVDADAPTSGTAYPAGTRQAPVNNLADAVLIAASRGLSQVGVLGDLEIDSGGDYHGLTFMGESKTKSVFTIDLTANVTGCEFQSAAVSGILDGDCVLRDCEIGDLYYVSGYVEDCVLAPGTITLGGGAACQFLNCVGGVRTTEPSVIDCGGDGPALTMRNYNGRVCLANKSGDAEMAIDLNSGEVELEPTVTAGAIVIRGVGRLVDNSVGATVDGSHLLSPERIAEVTTPEVVAALDVPTTEEVATKVWDLGDGIELALTPRQAMRLIAAASAGKLSGAEGTEIRIRDLADSTDRIIATVDESGNRLAVVTDVT